MEPGVRNLLYRNPGLYELVYPEAGDETPAMCRRMFARYLPRAPASILDIGCGTGRDLASLAREGADCTGIDVLPAMIEYARATRPQLRLEVGDMRSLRLGRTFDAILCMGSALMYAIADRDLRATMQTFVAHAHPGTLLVLDLNNASSWLAGGFAAESELRVDAPGFQARARVVYRLDRRRQTFTRSRVWSIPGQGLVEDRCEYRLLFPAELEHLLADVGFRIAGMFDNKELADGELAGSRLYVAAVADTPA